jgi:Kdo2-lipid IVA lauroyltransferase/acyltransferase
MSETEPSVVEPAESRGRGGGTIRARRKRGKRGSRRFAQWSEYIALRIAVAILRGLPRACALWLGEQGGRLACLLGARRRVVQTNLAHVGYSPEEQKRIEAGLYRRTGRYVIDALRGLKVPFELDQASGNALQAAADDRKGVLCLFSHLGNWELLLPFLGSQLSPGMVVAKPLHNPLINRWLEHERAAQAPDLAFVPPENALRQSLKSLRAGGLAAFAIDQYGGSSSPCVSFLGQPARTVRSTAGLEQRTHCRVVGVYALLDGENTYQIMLEALPPAAQDADTPELLERHNTLISGWVRKHPEHWFGWFHRRFKDVVEYP